MLARSPPLDRGDARLRTSCLPGRVRFAKAVQACPVRLSAAPEAGATPPQSRERTEASRRLILSFLPALRIPSGVPYGQDQDLVTVEQLALNDVWEATELDATGLLDDDGRDLRVPLDLRNARLKALQEGGAETGVLLLVPVASRTDVVPRSASERCVSAHSSDQSCARTSSQGMTSSG